VTALQDIMFAVAGVIVVCVVSFAAIALVRRRYAVITVDGISMLPTLENGDRVLIARRGPGGVRAGQIVVVRRPEPGVGWPDAVRPPRRLSSAQWYVKRAVALPGDAVPRELAEACPQDLGRTVPPASLLVLGDNPRSDDSKQWGYFPTAAILGVVVRRMRGVSEY
jgi:signal peptidase I